MKQIIIDLTYKKSTKNKHVYEHVCGSPIIQSLYIDKSAFDSNIPPRIVPIDLNLEGVDAKKEN